jgi:Na+-translocating ferredoxin:NAD+ oxidoreductase RnfD subunit
MSELTVTRPALPRIATYFRRPKGILILILAALVACAAAGPGWAAVAPGLAAACLAAVAVDLPILRMRKGAWIFPDGALLTGLIVAMVLSPIVPIHVFAITSAAAVASKYLARTHTANLFNPAALALVAAYHAFDTPQDWWGAMPEITPLALVLLVATGVFMTERVNKLALLLTFLGAYWILFTARAWLGDPAHVVEIFRAPDLHAALFFGFFMLTDPPTSPPRPRDQVTFGLIAAVVSYAVFEYFGVAYYLLAGLLAANLWEGWRRLHAHRNRRPHGH